MQRAQLYSDILGGQSGTIYHKWSVYILHMLVIMGNYSKMAHRFCPFTTSFTLIRKRFSVTCQADTSDYGVRCGEKP